MAILMESVGQVFIRITKGRKSATYKPMDADPNTYELHLEQWGALCDSEYRGMTEKELCKVIAGWLDVPVTEIVV